MTDEVEVQESAALDDGATIDGVEETVTAPESPEVTAASDAEVSSEEVDEKQLALNQIAFEMREKKRENKALQDRLAELEAKIPQAPVVAGAPKLEDFDYDEQAYNAALIKYQVDEGVKAIKQQQIEDQKRAEQNAIQSKFNSRVNTLKTKVTDYDEHIVNLPEFPAETLNTILQMEDGPEVALYLAKHADVADTVASVSPYAAGITLGKISLQLSNSKPTPKPSAAPDPINPIVQSGAAVAEREDPLLKGATFE